MDAERIKLALGCSSFSVILYAVANVVHECSEELDGVYGIKG